MCSRSRISRSRSSNMRRGDKSHAPAPVPANIPFISGNLVSLLLLLPAAHTAFPYCFCFCSLRRRRRSKWEEEQRGEGAERQRRRGAEEKEEQRGKGEE